MIQRHTQLSNVTSGQIYDTVSVMRLDAARTMSALVANGEAEDELIAATARFQTFDQIIAVIEAKEKATGGIR